MFSKNDKVYLENKFAELTAELVSKFATKAEFLSFRDQIVGEIQTQRQETTITVGYRGMIEELYDRVTMLEKREI